MRLNFKDPVSVFSLGTADSDGGGPLGSLIPGIGDAKAQKEANQINLNEAATNRQFQKEMSGTAYQRAMDDMKQAGLNPMLAYMQGGASTPSGSTASVQAASKTGLADKAMQAYTGISTQQNAATALQQQQQLNDSSIKLQASTAAKNLIDGQATNQKILESKERTEQMRLDNKRSKTREPFDDAAARVTNKLGQGINKALNYFDSSAKDTSDRFKNAMEPYERKIKVLGPATGKERSYLDGLKSGFSQLMK